MNMEQYYIVLWTAGHEIFIKKEKGGMKVEAKCL